MGIIQTLLKGLINPTNAYFIGVQAVVSLTLGWVSLLIAALLALENLPTPFRSLFQVPDMAWLWFAGTGILLTAYGSFFVYLLYRAANRSPLFAESDKTQE